MLRTLANLSILIISTRPLKPSLFRLLCYHIKEDMRIFAGPLFIDTPMTMGARILHQAVMACESDRQVRLTKVYGRVQYTQQARFFGRDVE